MTISSTTRKAGPFAGNGIATTFPFSFAVFDKTNVKAVLVNPNGVSSTLALDSDYSVQVNANQSSNPGGWVTYPISGSPLAAGYEMVLLGSLAYDQPTDITNSGGFYPNIIEDMSDRSTIQIQQLAEIASRAIVVNESESPPASLPTPSARANTLMGFDATGNLITMPITASVGAGDMHDELGSDGKPGFVSGSDFTPGTTAQFTLSRPPGGKANVALFFDSAYQGGDQILGINGQILTLTAPVPVGVQRVYIRTGTTLSIYLPPAGSVGTAQYQSNSIIDSVVNSLSALYRRLVDCVTPRDPQFGAVGDGVHDDTAAVQAWLNAGANGQQLYLAAGKYRVTSQITSAGYLTAHGDGMSASALVFSGNANWLHTGGAIGMGPSSQFILSNISLQSDDTLNTSVALLNVQFPSGGNGSTVRSVTVSDVEVCGTSLTKGFNGGMRFFNATTLKVSRPRVANRNTDSGNYLPGSFGIRMDTDSQAGDWYVDQANVYFCDQGISAIGQGNGAGFEGLTCTECLVIACSVGISVDSSVEHLYVRVSGCNINCVAKDIYIHNMIWVDITDNICYAYDNGTAVATWNGIELLYSDIAHGLNSANMIRGNIVLGVTSTHASSKNGIVFDSNANTEESQTLVDANTFVNLDAGIVLFNNTNNVAITDTNMYRQVTLPVADSSSNSTNTYAYASLGSPGASRDNGGKEERWASNVAVTITGGTGSVVFPQAFRNSCDSVVCQNGNPAGTFGTNVVSVVNSSVNATGFGVFVSGGGSGTLTLNYQAKGH